MKPGFPFGDNGYDELLEFAEEVYELAFGDDAINKEFPPEEVLAKLREFSDKALAFDNEDEAPAMRS